MVGIYKITNKVNGKLYIGQSINIAQRWKAHKTRPFNFNSTQYESPLYRAIRKYGLSNFTFEVLEECTEEELNQKEKSYIAYYQSCNPEKGYNLTTGGQNSVTVNSKMTEEMVNEIYNLLMRSNLSQEQIAQQFNLSQRSISGINTGEYKVKAGYIYPLQSYRTKEVKKYFCPNCGREITKYGKLCSECAKIAQRRVSRPDRDTLKEDIRKYSFVEIGRKYGVSDNAIRKWCKGYGLPYKKTLIKKISDEEWPEI